MILHTVNTSPFSTFSLQDCLKQLESNDKLLLLGDAVLAASASVEQQSLLLQLDKEQRLFILDVDLTARGLHAIYGEVIDYPRFVQLSIACKSQLAW